MFLQYNRNLQRIRCTETIKKALDAFRRVPFTSFAMSRKRISGCASDKKNLPFMTTVFLQRRRRRRRQTKKLIALSSNKISMFGFYKLYVRVARILRNARAITLQQTFYKFKKIVIIRKKV